MLEFLDRIGIAYRIAKLDEQTFLPGIAIDGGTVIIDPERLAYPGDILHEAGHIAVTEPSRRGSLNQEVLGSESPKESDEIGVMLWTYLAAKELGIPPAVVFHAGGYRGSAEWLIEQFEGGTYIGLPLLTWMGITENPPPGERPRVISWLRTRD